MSCTRFLPIIVFVLLFSFRSIEALPITYANDFYEQYIIEGNQSIQGFTGIQTLLLTVWDYVDDAPSKRSFSEHFQGLYYYLITNNFRQVVVYIKDPSQYDFYDPTGDASSTNNICYWLNLMLAEGITVIPLFDYTTFSWTGTFTGPNGDQISLDSNTLNPDQIPSDFYFQDIWKKMSWVTKIRQDETAIQIGSTVWGACIDPELSGHDANDYQAIVNYMDQYRLTYDTTANNAMTFGIDARPSTYANTAEFPISDATIIAMIDASLSPNFPGNGSNPIPIPSWRSAGDGSPLLQRVYLQIYQDTFNYIYTQTASCAAASTISAFKNFPYKPATFVITANTTSTTVTSLATHTVNSENIHYAIPSSLSVGDQIGGKLNGTNLSFGTIASIQSTTGGDADNSITLSALPPINYVGPLYVNTSGTWTTPSISATATTSSTEVSLSGSFDFTPTITCAMHVGGLVGGSVQSIGKISSYDSNANTLTLYSNSSIDYSGDLYVTEYVADWTVPSLDSSVTDSIYFLFSANGASGLPFFGRWPLNNFTSFLQSAAQQATSSPINGGFFQNSQQYGIYSVYLSLFTYQPNRASWFPCPYCQGNCP